MKTIVNYAQKVKEQHALSKTLAPVETDLTDASRSYAIGEQFINDGDLFKAKTAIAQHDALVLDTNYEAADDITTQIKNKTVTTDPVPTEGSTNPVQSNGVFVENRNIYEVMGEMGAKNKLPFDLATIKENNTTGTWNNNVYTLNGVDFTFNADGSVLVDGTASANAEVDYLLNLSISGDFILSDAVAGVANNYWAFAKIDGDSSNLLILTSDEMPASISSTMDYFRIKVFSGKTASNIMFKPMLRPASDTDNTFQPYAKTNQQLTAENEALTNNVSVLAENGAVNLAPNNLVSQTANGITFVVNDDKSISASGTCTSNIRLDIGTITLKKDITYRISDRHDGKTAGNSDCQIIARTSGGTWLMVSANTASPGNTYTPDADTVVSVTVTITNGATIDTTLYPMIVNADYSGDYVPYAKTNRELTAENQTLTNQTNDMVNVLGAKNLLLNKATTQTINGITFTVNTDGSLTVNGTATEDFSFVINGDKDWIKTGLDFIFTGGIPYDAYAANLAIVFVATLGGSTEFILAGDTFKFNSIPYSCIVTLWCPSGQTYNNVTFKPMIRLASDTDDTYQPYSMTNQELTPIAQAVSNRNLLDNPWFTVNQRGQSTYSVTGTTDTYTVDRWSMIAWAGKTVSLDVDASGVTFSAGVNSFRQKLYDIWDALVGKKLTLSIEYTSTTASGQVGIVKGGSWDSNTVINFKTGHNVDSVTFTAESGTTPMLWIYIPETNTDFNIKAVKLELGSVSTLAMDTAPNYATELLKCQRYFERVKFPQNGSIGIGFAISTTELSVPMNITPKRAWPAITASALSSIVASRGSQGEGASVTSIAIHGMMSNYLTIKFGGTFTKGDTYCLYSNNNASNYVDISADL